MPTALVVSRYFPPSGSAGASIRLTKIIKFGNQEGWKFVVFTQDPEFPVRNEITGSKHLLDELPADVEIHYIKNPITSNLFWKTLLGFLFLDSSIPWVLAVIYRIINFLRKQNVDIVFSNSPPYTNVAIGFLISQLRKIPFFIDMKDDWVGSAEFQKKTFFSRILNKKIEELFLSRARFTFFSSTESLKMYGDRYLNKPFSCFFKYIPNGIDTEEYEELKNKKKEILTKKFLLLTGAVGYRKNYRDLTPFLSSIILLFSRHPEIKRDFEIVFLSTPTLSDYQERIISNDLTRVISIHPPVERKKFINWLWTADLFFLIQPTRNRTAISGTLYEYWATGKAPILLISESGASSQLVNMHHIGKSFSYTQIEEISDYIYQIYLAYKKQSPIYIQNLGIGKFDRKKNIQEMISYWNLVVNKGLGIQ